MIVEGLDVTRIAHACIKILTKNKVIYFDPFQIQSGAQSGQSPAVHSGAVEKADYIFITHEHYDHCSVADIKKIITTNTIIITVPDCQSKLAGLPFKDMKLVKPGDHFKLNDLEVQVVPAYNTNKHFHMKDNHWVGFIVKIDGKIVYHMGDTDVIPEMKNLKGIDVMFVPVSGTYVMNPKEAAELVNYLKPKTAVPIHYGAIVGSNQDAEMFKSLLKDVNVVIL